MAARARNWHFTVNDWTPDDQTWFRLDLASYIVFGVNDASQQLHGFLQLEWRECVEWLRTHIHKTCQWKMAIGTAAQNIERCLTANGNNIVYQRGRLTKPEKRYDVDEVTRDIAYIPMFAMNDRITAYSSLIKKREEHFLVWHFTLEDWCADDRDMFEKLECVRFIVLETYTSRRTKAPHLKGLMKMETPTRLAEMEDIHPAAKWHGMNDIKLESIVISYFRGADAYRRGDPRG